MACSICKDPGHTLTEHKRTCIVCGRVDVVEELPVGSWTGETIELRRSQKAGYNCGDIEAHLEFAKHAFDPINLDRDVRLSKNGPWIRPRQVRVTH